MKNYEILFPTTLDWKNVTAQAALLLIFIVPLLIMLMPGTGKLSIKQRQTIIIAPIAAIFLIPIGVGIYSINANDNSYSTNSGDRAIHKNNIIKICMINII